MAQFRSQKNLLGIFWFSCGLICSLICPVQGQTCTLTYVNSQVVNAANQFVVKFNPSSSSAQAESTITLSFPSYLGFTKDSGLFRCSGYLGGVGFNSGTPTCTQGTGSSGEFEIEVSNLVNADITQYALTVYGIINGPVATANKIDGTIGQTTTITCVSKGSTGSTLETATVADSTIDQTPVTSDSAFTFTVNPTYSNVNAELSLVVYMTQQIVVSGSVSIGLPYQNVDYSSLGASSNVNYFASPGSAYATASYDSGSTYPVTVSSVATRTVGSVQWMDIMLGNSAIIPSNAVLTVTIGTIKNPPNLKYQTGFSCQTGDQYLNQIEIASISLHSTLPAIDSYASTASVAEIVGSNGVLVTDSQYRFTIYPIGDIPSGGYMELYIPSEIGVPSSPATQFVFTCSQNCKSSSATLTWSSGTRILKMANTFPTNSDYVSAGSAIIFTLTGFTNPAGTSKYNFIWTSYAVISGQNYKIDQLSNMGVSAQLGSCSEIQFYPSDGNRYIYGQPASWYLKMQCSHEIALEYGVQITFARDNGFLVKQTPRCTVESTNQYYSCSASNSLSQVTIMRFSDTPILANELFELTFDSVINPGWTNYLPLVTVSSISDTGNVIDTGYFKFDYEYFYRGYVQKFTVTPQDFGVGQYPVYYDFEVQPIGEVWVNSYFIITLPSQLSFYQERTIEKFCSYNVTSFADNTYFDCKVTGQYLKITNAFSTGNTTHMTQDHDFEPPTFKFTLPQFVNPRTTGISSAFDIAFYDGQGKTLYDWDTTNSSYAYTLNGVNVTNVTQGPCVQMSTAATPQFVSIKRGSDANGVVNAYNFTVRTTNSLYDGDEIHVQVPKQIGLSNDTYCLGSSGNLDHNQSCSISDDNTKIVMTLKIVSSKRMLTSRSLQARQIKSNEEFIFSIQNVKNPISFEPTTSSITYSVYSGGKLIESLDTGMIVKNTRAGAMNPSQMSIIPADFRKNRITNYTLEFFPTNYAQNMRMLIALPSQIEFASSAVICHGLSGTDSPQVKCSTSASKKWIRIDDAFAFQPNNPGKIRIMFEAFKNPSDNVITESFKIATQTPTKYLLDVASNSLQVNFICEYPCASCDKDEKTKCLSCYGGVDDYNMFYDFQCLRTCPLGMTNTTTNNCTECFEPCKTCSIQPGYCTSCISGYTVVLDSGYCREVVYWPFPFLLLSFVSFFVILASEIVTKQESRFKETFIASLATYEFFAWMVLTYFMYLKKGTKGPTALAGGAVLVSVTLNFAHACMHPRKIVPNSLPSYKTLFSKHKCSTYMVMTVSCLISFKFSLMLVSYFWMHPRYSGDYSALNWMQFNKFSFAFLIIPYPMVMLACGYFLTTDGMFSYAGFVSIEVIILSTTLSTLMFPDASSVMKCRVSNPGVRKPQKVATGLTHDDDLDEHNTRRILKKKTGKMNLEGDESDDDTLDKITSHAALKPSSRMDEETRRQILLLEELAKQMRDEKEQLRLEKERIERERALFEEEEAKEEMKNYLYEQDRLQNNLDQNTADITGLIHDKSNLTRRPYKDIEGEMEDYERIDEDEHESESEGEAIQVEFMPEPAFGQINYFRQKDGEEQTFFQQVSPRAGGDSMRGIYDVEAEPEYNLLSNTRPVFDEDVTRRNSLQTNEDYAIRDDVSAAGITNMERSRSAVEEVFQDKSDAEMDLVTNHGRSAHNDQAFIENKDEPVQGLATAKSQSNDIAMVEKQPSAIGDNVSNPTTRMANQDMFQAPETAAHGGVTPDPNTHRSDNTQKYLENEPATYSALDDQREGRGETQHFFNQEPEVVDESGHSESSEGIVDHGGFNKITDTNNQIRNQQNNSTIQNSSSKNIPTFIETKLEERLNQRKEPDLRASLTNRGRPAQDSQEALQESPMQNKNQITPQAQNNRKKQIIYSDKSESSVEDMMGDTPSNYNLANGRLDGKSMGLKAILQQAQKHAGVNLGGGLQLDLKKAGMGLGGKATLVNNPDAEDLTKSQEGAWAASNPLAGHRVPIIAEDNDEHDYTTGGGVAPSGVAGKRKAIKTNKQFAEPPLPGSSYKYQSLTPQNMDAQPQQQVRKNNFL